MRYVGVVAGKGGTGKTTTALSLANAVPNAALLDLDLTMPTVPAVLNGEVEFGKEELIPVKKQGVEYFSIGFFGEDPLTWDSSKIKDLVDDLFRLIRWDNPDYLFIDAPPGTDSVFTSVMPKLDSTIIVTNPSLMSYMDARRVVELLKEEEIGICGEIRNMAYYKCAICGHLYYPFGSPSNFSLDIPLLCEIPMLEQTDSIIPKEYLPVDSIIDAIKNPVKERVKERKSRKRDAMRMILGLRR